MQIHARSPLATALVTLLVVAVLGVVWVISDPLPPKTVVIATSAPSSNYALVAQKYQARFAREGIHLDIRHTRGSGENVDLIRDAASGVSLALAPTGFAATSDAIVLNSLGGVFYAPLWVFYRSDETVDRFSQFKGKRISTGAPGSAVHRYSRGALAESGVTEANSRFTELLDPDALAALRDGRVDVIMFPAVHDAPLLAEARKLPGVRLMNVAQAEGIYRRNPALHRVVLPRGSFDLATDDPPSDLNLISGVNSMIVRRDVHPAVQYLMLEAMREVHSAPGPFHRFDEFPAPQALDLPLTRFAERYYKRGRPLLFDYLPFWLAAFFDAIALYLIPAAAIVWPALQFAGPAHVWLAKKRIHKLYHALALAEKDADAATDDAARAALIARLDEIEQQARALKIPEGLTEQAYQLRANLRMVRGSIPAASTGAETN